MKLLLGPGPSNVDRRVYEALSRPLVGHLDPEFLEVMNEIQHLLRYTFRTQNRLAIPLSGTGSAGMEAALVNFVQKGDPVLVGVAGLFGERMCDIVQRCGGRLARVDADWGHPLPLDSMERAIRTHRPRIVAVVHGETSTGVRQPLEELSRVTREQDSLFLVDAVTTLGGVPLEVDRWQIDLCYSGTQKCLSCPPGLSPLTVSDRGAEVLRSRRLPVQSWYLDLTLVQKYWGAERTYHHTAPISMNYALLEALRIVHEETLEARWSRHEENHRALVVGLSALGLEMLVDPEYRLWSLNTVKVPPAVEEERVRQRLLRQHDIEIGGGLGILRGKIWRIGLMGTSCVRENVQRFVEAFAASLQAEGFPCSARDALDQAGQVYKTRDA
ncbi:MAG: alanine--glyoxylate aminotransferase family protein [Acidobacteria bacterium]|nr:alanine--glyoxylate aminotransferase family protein [Acidobacteriota bacterium]